jgi:hypothetical protein
MLGVQGPREMQTATEARYFNSEVLVVGKAFFLRDDP